MIALADETFLPFADRVKSALEKSRYYSEDENLVKKTDEADYFMKVLCKNPNLIVNPERIRPISGMIQ